MVLFRKLEIGLFDVSLRGVAAHAKVPIEVGPKQRCCGFEVPNRGKENR